MNKCSFKFLLKMKNDLNKRSIKKLFGCQINGCMGKLQNR